MSDQHQADALLESPDLVSPTRPQTGRSKVVVIGLVIVGVLSGAFYFYTQRGAQDGAHGGPPGSAAGPRGPGGPGGPPSANGPVPVRTGHAERRDVDLQLRAVGTVVPEQTAVVRPRVEGVLERVLFSEGQDVIEGALLAELDARPLRATLREADAVLERDQAALDQAQIVRVRTLQLRERDLAAAQDLDAADAEIRRLTAQVHADRASRENARLALAYTRITAPLNGVVGLRNVDPGNIVSPGDANGLAVITSIDPISVRFSIPQDELGHVQEQMRAGPIAVSVLARDDVRVLAEGVLTVIDNRIDEGTGTVRLKASVPNAARLLWPHQLVSVRLLVETRRQALVVPDAAVQQGPEGAFVYVVGTDNVATPRAVRIERTVGELALIDGISEAEEIVLEGQSRLRPGQAIERLGSAAVTQPAPGQPASGRPTPGQPAPSASPTARP